MFNNIKVLFICFSLFIFSTSCVAQQCYQKSPVLPVKSFVFIEKKIETFICASDLCVRTERNASGSGFIVSKTKDGSFAVTAEHICAAKAPIDTGGIVKAHNVVKLKIRTFDNEPYEATILETRPDIDICIVFIRNLTHVEPIPVSEIAPEIGDKVYNIASPLGIFEKNTVPIFEGRYSGELIKEMSALYSLPAAGGSSGSMILNEDGEIIGVLHSVYVRLPHLVLATPFVETREFILKNIKKYKTYKKVMHILELDDIF